jgi:hypothetical protein
MFNQSDIDQLINNLESTIQTEETTFTNVCKVRLTMHLQDQEEGFYAGFPMFGTVGFA